jgi:hypothetical protein
VISIGCLAVDAAMFYSSYSNEMSCNRSFECDLIQCPTFWPPELIAGL